MRYSQRNVTGKSREKKHDSEVPEQITAERIRREMKRKNELTIEGDRTSLSRHNL